MKLFLLLGIINGFLAVALGAFGAHGLEGKLVKNLSRFGRRRSIIKCFMRLHYL